MLKSTTRIVDKQPPVLLLAVEYPQINEDIDIITIDPLDGTPSILDSKKVPKKKKRITVSKKNWGEAESAYLVEVYGSSYFPR